MPEIRCIVLVFLLPVMLLGMPHDLHARGVKDNAATPAGPSAVIAAMQATVIAPYDDVRGKDLTELGGKFDAVLLQTLWLNLETKLDAAGARTLAQIVEAGRNPGLGVRALHAQGVTGKGVAVAIIDQNLPGTDHPEYRGKVAKYQDVGTGTDAARGSMHGPAVLSLLVGAQAGTAPDAVVYYAAAPSWLGDAKYYADALTWIVEENRRLPGGGKIRVVSVSAAPSGPGSPFTKNGGEWDAAVKAANAAGILVLDCTQTYGIIGPCYYDPSDPENVRKVVPGFPGQAGWNAPPDHVLAPTSYRSTAESDRAGQNSWQYTGRGGLSWGIPWAAGVLAMGWQVNPSLGPEAIVGLLRESAFERGDGNRIIDPAAFIAAVRKTVR
jgi:serine protease AprX